MSRFLAYTWIVLALPLTMALAGCGQTEPATSQPSASEPTAMEDSHADHDQSDMAESSQQAENLAKLSPEDQALAERQKVCPVSGEPLGAMGVPYKVTVQGRDVLLCCDGCEETIKENPDKYLAKLSP